MIFIYVPSYVGYHNTKNYENDISQTKEVLKKMIDPANTLVVGMDAYRYGFREAGYYSPEYFVVLHPETTLFSDVSVYAMHNRKTVILDKIPKETYPRFVTYPIPEYKETYKKFYEDMIKVFPEGTVSMVSINGYIIIKGPSSELKYLFPKTGSEQMQPD
jgi:hypothetical protein